MSRQFLRAVRLTGTLVLLIAAAGIAGCQRSGAGEVASEVRIPTGAGGVGFLPLLMMERHQLVERYGREEGLPDLRVRSIDLGGPAIMNDALLSGSLDFIAAGPPGFLTLWDRTVTSAKVMGVAAMTSLPMYLNTHAPHLRTIDDLTDQDKIAVTSVKVSIPSLVMQMHARSKYGPDAFGRFDKYTVTMTHPDGVAALLSGSGSVNAHFTSPPFHQRERKDPRIRTVMTTNDVMGGSTTFTMLSTTTAFRERNPAIYRAVLKALREANRRIEADKRAAAELLLTSAGEGGFTVDEMVEVLNDPDITFTTTPEHVMKYAAFMADIGSIANRPASWKDLFFPDIHAEPGS